MVQKYISDPKTVQKSIFRPNNGLKINFRTQEWIKKSFFIFRSQNSGQKVRKHEKKSGQKIKKHRIYRPRNGSKIHFSYPEMGQKFRNILIFRNSFFRASNYSKMHILTGNGLSFGFRSRRWVFLALAEMTDFFVFWAGNGSFFFLNRKWIILRTRSWSQIPTFQSIF